MHVEEVAKAKESSTQRHLKTCMGTEFYNEMVFKMYDVVYYCLKHDTILLLLTGGKIQLTHDHISMPVRSHRPRQSDEYTHSGITPDELCPSKSISIILL